MQTVVGVAHRTTGIIKGEGMSNKSIVPPVDHGDKAPVKKSTLIGILGIVIVVFIIGAAMGSMRAPVAKTEVKAKEDSPETRRGTGRDVSEEFSAEQERQRVASIAPKPAQQKPLVPEPMQPVIPVAVQRSSNGTAVENKLTPEEERQKALAERDSRGAVSSITVFDASEKPGKDIGTTQVERGLNPVSRQTQINTREEALRDQLRLRQELQAIAGQEKEQAPVSATASWMRQIDSTKKPKTIYPHKPEGKFLLTQGKTIPSILLRSMNTDLPCEVSARTLVDVYDSLEGRALLIPRGSDLIGKCSSNVAAGQSRVLFAFQRIILPNGRSFDLPNAMGMDQTGSSGIEGDVNNHFLKMFWSSFVVAFVSQKAEKNAPANNNLIGGSGGARTAAGEVLVDVGKTILNRNKNIQPTITVDAGTRINVNVAADMNFLEPYEN